MDEASKAASITDVMTPDEIELIDRDMQHFANPDNVPAPREPWKITDIGSADWAMRRLAAALSAQAEFEAQAHEWEILARQFNSQIDYFAERLETWGIEQRAVTSLKTIKLPAGSISTRENPAKFVVTDSDALLEWARVNAPDAVKVVESVLKSKLNIVEANGTVVDAESGEIVPGITVEPATITASAKPIARDLL